MQRAQALPDRGHCGPRLGLPPRGHGHLPGQRTGDDPAPRIIGASVQQPWYWGERGRSADIIHTSEVLFIDPAGRERYVASPMADYTTKAKAYLPAGSLTAWGQGVAQVTRTLSH